MEAKEINRYKGKSIPQLIKIAERYFNAFIRQRDKSKGCISCGKPVTEAGHYLSAGHHAIHRFNEHNVNGQCTHCNRWLHGNLINYRIGLIAKIGEDKVEWIERTRNHSYKWDRFSLIDTILKYKRLLKS